MIHFYKRPEDVTPTVTKYIVKMFLWILSEGGVEKINIINRMHKLGISIHIDSLDMIKICSDLIP